MPTQKIEKIADIDNLIKDYNKLAGIDNQPILGVATLETADQEKEYKAAIKQTVLALSASISTIYSRGKMPTLFKENKLSLKLTDMYIKYLEPTVFDKACTNATSDYEKLLNLSKELKKFPEVKSLANELFAEAGISETIEKAKSPVTVDAPKAEVTVTA